MGGGFISDTTAHARMELATPMKYKVHQRVSRSGRYRDHCHHCLFDSSPRGINDGYHLLFNVELFRIEREKLLMLTKNSGD